MNTEMIVVPVFFGMLGFVVWVVVNGWQRRQQVKVMTDFNSRLFDRLGSALHNLRAPKPVEATGD